MTAFWLRGAKIYFKLGRLLSISGLLEFSRERGREQGALFGGDVALGGLDGIALTRVEEKKEAKVTAKQEKETKKIARPFRILAILPKR